MPAKNTLGSMRWILEGYQSEISVAVFYWYKFGLRSSVQMQMYRLFFINRHSEYKRPISKHAN